MDSYSKENLGIFSFFENPLKIPYGKSLTLILIFLSLNFFFWKKIKSLVKSLIGQKHKNLKKILNSENTSVSDLSKSLTLK